MVSPKDSSVVLEDVKVAAKTSPTRPISRVASSPNPATPQPPAAEPQHGTTPSPAATPVPEPQLENDVYVDSQLVQHPYGTKVEVYLQEIILRDIQFPTASLTVEQFYLEEGSHSIADLINSTYPSYRSQAFDCDPSNNELVLDIELLVYVEPGRSIVFTTKSEANEVVFWAVIQIEDPIDDVVGGHTLTLYNFSQASHLAELSEASMQGGLTIELKVVTDDFSAPTPDLSEMNDQDVEGEDTEIPWLDVDNSKKLDSQLFVAGDAFDVYVDGARFLPDNVCMSKATVMVLSLDRTALEHEKHWALAELSSPVFNPDFNLVCIILGEASESN